MKRLFWTIAVLLFGLSACKGQTHTFSPSKQWGDAAAFVSAIEISEIGGVKPRLETTRISEGLTRFTVVYKLKKEVSQDDVRIVVRPSFDPEFHWAPHLTPTDNHVIDQHVFRNPAMLMQDGDSTLTLLVSPRNAFTERPYRIYADMNALQEEMTLGISRTKITEHVLYEREPGAVVPAGETRLEFYLMTSSDPQTARNPFRPILAFYWTREGHAAYEKTDFSQSSFDRYCERTYRWAFDGWRKAVWQEFDCNGRRIGAPVFIVDVTQSPNYPGQAGLREDCSIWNQAWFSSLRSASGLYRYALRTRNDSLMQKARMTKELALCAPQKDGLFYAVAATPTTTENRSGHAVSTSGGWENHYWGNSNRNPVTWDLKESPFHLLDMSWTAYVMLEWYTRLEKDERLLQYAVCYADRLVSLQDDKGYYPAWIDTQTGGILPYLTDSPESSMSAWFLLKLHQITGDKRYETSALKALDVVIREIVPTGRWEDFETYWSCCRYGSDRLVGQKVARNDMYKQCNFSMYWTAGALLEAYRQSGRDNYLQTGIRVIDELLMTQASWQPPHIYVDAVGGFGVLNADGEWNDSRASLFAELLLEYGKETARPEYRERALMALRSAFTMMYCPENPKTKALWEKTWPFFSEKDYGFLMENYGHAGAASPEGEGMGNFTIYDWGNGAACEAYNRILDNWGDDLFPDK